MNVDKIKATIGRIDLSTHDLKPTITLGTCSKTGRPKVSVGLVATDNGVRPGVSVRSDIRAGGVGWPPHTVVLDSDDEEHVFKSVLDALHLASRHEDREHFFVDGVLKYDPHAAV